MGRLYHEKTPNDLVLQDKILSILFELSPLPPKTINDMVPAVVRLSVRLCLPETTNNHTAVTTRPGKEWKMAQGLEFYRRE